ncbi:putative AsnC family transcriptional regulator [Streptomyces sp. NBRC 110611]|uniref:Lrp/AsnC family transcriptional regulator n=1 Tax=Streptomyces sp. NBRC 110611 TaxID=1621259 RepID=UPI00082FFC44|nr:AsnC family transcriptional regulator [Streptomyces sp. NBRC 110611]GAU67895.1 putative AsnC family transcriptional regulator [Streptomyces sp. NBRC 110611]
MVRRAPSTLDDVDRGLIHALHIDGRAPLSRIAEVLGVSPQTVARRYQRLYAEAGLRVVGLVEPHHAGQAQWLVRLTAAPHSAQDLAQALARRTDTSWVKLASGGTEIIAVVHAPAAGTGRHPLLLHDIPRTAGITAVSAHYLLHTYLGGPTAWRGRASILDEQQRRRLTPRHRAGHDDEQLAGIADLAAEFGTSGELSDVDERLMTALQRDGRASHTELAAATGWSAATVARRLTALQAGGALFFDLEFDDALYGATTQALLWLTVAPTHLERVATSLARHDELAFVAATTGRTNVVAHALCPDPAALHHYLTRRLGSHDAIHALETAPVLRTVKGAGLLPRRRLGRRR